MPDIFLSYNRQDRPAAERFAAALEARALDVWWDAGLKVGEAYDEVTEEALRSARAVVVLWSPRSVTSRWVRAEATVGLRQGTLFPVMIEACERPVMFELTQTADLTHWTGARADPVWRAFVADLEAFMAAPRKPPAAAARPDSADGGKAAGSGAVPLMSARPGGFRNQQARRRFLIGGGLAAGAAIAGAGGLFLWQGRHPAVEEGSKSLAVLPFRNISANPDEDYFSEGLSAELRAALTRNPDLQVAAPTSSRSAGAADADIRAIARQLGVAFLLQGTVAKAGKQVRVSADLVDARAGLTRWSQVYERSLADIFAVQSEIAAKVADALAARISEAVAGATASGSTRTTAAKPDAASGSGNGDAFEDLLHGRAAYSLAASEETDREALMWFDRAIAKDPDYAAAHTWRARALSVLAAQSGDPATMRPLRDDAIAAATRAVQLAPDFALARSTLAWVLFNQALDARRAKVEFDRARALAPGDADTLMAFALFCARTGRLSEARRDMARALVLDPLNASAFRISGTIAIIARDYEQALGELERALRLNPGMSIVNAFKGEALFQLGRLPDARAAYEAEPSPTFKLAGLAMTDWKMGNTTQALASLEALRTQFGDSALFQQGQILAQFGEPDAAMDALERGYEQGDSGLAQLRSDSFLSPLHPLARFQALLSRIGFDLVPTTQ